MTNAIRSWVKALSGSGRIGLVLVVFWLLIATVGPFLAPYDPGAFVAHDVFAGFTGAHLLGSDYLGRDVL
ncbi:MAG: hypothetical protein JHC88_17350, partial [Niveispirillum sp.]|nr:hypothetical protein [Niveispirillum sp.]